MRLSSPHSSLTRPQNDDWSTTAAHQTKWLPQAGMVGHFGTVDAQVIGALALSRPALWGSALHLL